MGVPAGCSGRIDFCLDFANALGRVHWRRYTKQMMKLAQNILLSLPPELSHNLAISGLNAMGQLPGQITPLQGRKVTFLGHELANPIGLAAGLDKDAQAVIRAIGPMVHFWHLTQVDEPRALASEQLMTRLSVVDQVRAETTGSVKQALENAVRLSGGIDTIVVFGSFPVVGEALEYLDHHPGARLQ